MRLALGAEVAEVTGELCGCSFVIFSDRSL